MEVLKYHQINITEIKWVLEWILENEGLILRNVEYHDYQSRIRTKNMIE